MRASKTATEVFATWRAMHQEINAMKSQLELVSDIID
jgi:hypothetical protein